MDSTKTRARGGQALPGDFAAPLKPKPGLSGPPVEEQKKLGFVPAGCSEPTYVKGPWLKYQQQDEQPKYARLPLCGEQPQPR